MIIILNGPLGVGKTETAWALLGRCENGAMLDADYVAALHPFDYYDPADLERAHAALEALMRHHASAGARDFVLNWVFEEPEQLACLRARLEGVTGPSAAFRLRCSPEELERRIRGRSRPSWELWHELKRGRELRGILDRAAKTGNLGDVIETDGLSADEVAARIWAAAQARGKEG